ncbi:MAG: hypothetical protein PHP82_02470 [Candidatus ainarchaeum sp.]|nr:hypothetical protein [Candidatus ainarchaeum sp.]
MKKKPSIGITKFVIGILLSNIIRLFRFIPNNDPIMAIMLPYAKSDKKYKAVLFPFITMVSFDVITGMLGIWTLVTALTYAGIAFLFTQYFFKERKISIFKYLKGGIIGVLIFDFITGPIMSSLMFGMSFIEAGLGQIPFTLMHLTTVSCFIIIITPLYDKHVLENSSLTDYSIVSFFKQKLFLKN